jgi:HD-GYP domain-containing protein (c-di-GMP phosphodiesterase class II)
MLATMIGTTLGLDQVTLHELGFGCLIHDIGMMAIDRRSFESKKVLELDEFLEIAKHPIKTFDIIAKNLDAVPVNARMVAFQIHERFNGEGYPRRREGENIHPLARIAAVADAYTALVSPRPYRPGMLPYFAMEKMVRDTSRGLFDPKVVRALLETVGLFPLGSFVEMTNEYVGRVIRANGKQYAQPIVEVWKKGSLIASPTIVDLANDSMLKIVKATSSLEE